MNLAHPSDRIVAGLIDLVVAGLLHSLLMFTLWPIGLFWLGGIASVAYLVFRDSLPFLNYQSVGKKIVKLKVIRRNGNHPLTPKESFQRNFVFLPNLLNVFGFALTYTTSIILLLLLALELYKLYQSEDKQRFGDELAGTLVVKEGV